eukprot:1089449-Prymnesium_polylepis.1
MTEIRLALPAIPGHPEKGLQRRAVVDGGAICRTQVRPEEHPQPAAAHQGDVERPGRLHTRDQLDQRRAPAPRFRLISQVLGRCDELEVGAARHDRLRPRTPDRPAAALELCAYCECKGVNDEDRLARQRTSPREDGLCPVIKRGGRPAVDHSDPGVERLLAKNVAREVATPGQQQVDFGKVLTARVGARFGRQPQRKVVTPSEPRDEVRSVHGCRVAPGVAPCVLDVDDRDTVLELEPAHGAVPELVDADSLLAVVGGVLLVVCGTNAALDACNTGHVL